MDEWTPVITRFGVMTDLALLMGLPLFHWSMGGRAHRGMLAMLAIGGIALSALWLCVIAATMMGMSMGSQDWSSISMVLTQTPIGPVLAVRGGALLAVLVACLFAGGGRTATFPAAIAAATLAWTGHAGASEAMTGTIHRVADVAHIWAAAGWIGALATLLYIVVQGRMPVARMAAMLSRFSLWGTGFVATLIFTGALNAVMIVGAADIRVLIDSRYGQLLGAKILLFIAMLVLAALNRWRLTPALEQGGSDRAIIRDLRLSLTIETGIAVAIIMLVSWLGTLDPMG